MNTFLVKSVSEVYGKDVSEVTYQHLTFINDELRDSQSTYIRI